MTNLELMNEVFKKLLEAIPQEPDSERKRKAMLVMREQCRSLLEALDAELNKAAA